MSKATHSFAPSAIGRERQALAAAADMPKVTPQCQLASTDGFEKPKNAKYTCKCGETFDGLKAWREHMVQRSLLRKRKPMTPRSLHAHAQCHRCGSGVRQLRRRECMRAD